MHALYLVPLSGSFLSRMVMYDLLQHCYLRGTIVNRTEYYFIKMVGCIVFFMYTIGPINYGPPYYLLYGRTRPGTAAVIQREYSDCTAKR